MARKTTFSKRRETEGLDGQKIVRPPPRIQVSQHFIYTVTDHSEPCRVWCGINAPLVGACDDVKDRPDSLGYFVTKSIPHPGWLDHWLEVYCIGDVVGEAAFTKMAETRPHFKFGEDLNG